VTDTQETLQSALADLTRRVAAFEKAQKKAADVEPPVCSEALLAHMERGVELGTSDYKKAASEIRYLRAELARLREGLKVQEGDITDTLLSDWWRELGTNRLLSPTRAALREIQRHRALVTK
jgi:hypothetical protein